MYHSGPLLHPGYSGASAVDFDLEDHGRQIQLVGQRALRNATAGQGDSKHLEYRGRRKAAAADASEIVESGNGLGRSSVK